MPKKKVKEAMSLEDLQRALNDAVQGKFGKGDGTIEQWRYYVVETFPDYVIARGQDEKLYQIPYAVNVAGEVELGEAREVEQVYVPVAESARFLATEAEATEDGWSWPVQIIEAGPASGAVDSRGMGHEFTEAVVAEFAAASNGARFGRRHPGPMESEDDPARIAGWFSNGSVVGRTAQARLNLLKTETDLRGRLMAAQEAGKMDLFGLSVLAYVAFKPRKAEGKTVLVSEKLARLVSVDLVTEAGAGGKFLSPLRVAASAQLQAEISALQESAVKVSPGSTRGENGGGDAGRNIGGAMKEQIMKVLEALRKHDHGRAAEFKTEFEGLAEEKYPEFLLKLSEAAAQVAESAVGKDATAAKDLLKLVRETHEETKKIQSANLVERKIAEAVKANLPQPAAVLVREHLAGQVVEETAVDAEIKRVREAFASYSSVGRVGAPRTGVALDHQDKVQLAFDRLMGVREAVADANVHRFRGIREAYVLVTGDDNLDFGANGRGGFGRVREATVVTADFPNILLNSMTKRLLQDYAELGMGGLDQIVSFTDIDDFKTQDRVRLGYLADLATVAEDGAYTDFAKPTDEKVSYAATKRGNLLPITRETILNDDLGKITAFPGRIARASRRTLKQFIVTFLTSNPNFDPDGVALFHATHANLGAAELSVDELIQREIALFKQTEKDSAKPLGLTLDWLVVPIDLKARALKINNSEEYNPGPNIFEPNPFYKRFGANGERVIVVELLADTNDWYYGTMPANAPSIEVGFVQGQREPQILLQNDPQTGAVFTNDRITYKVRHEYGGDITDFRGIGKNVVP